MNCFVKIMATILAFMMLLCVLASCNMIPEAGGESDTLTETEDVSESVDGGSSEEVSDALTAWETDEDGFIKDSHDGVDLNKRVIRILCGNSFEEEGTVKGSAEFHTDSGNIGTPVKLAIFTRNMTVEKRLNCKLQWIDLACEYANYGEFAARAAELSGANEIDLIGAYSLTSSSMMVQGLLADLNTSETIELEKPWWNKEMIDSCTIQNRMYFCSGDISYGVVGGSYVFLTNKKIMEDSGVNSYIKESYGYESIYELVRDKKWTLDVMIDLSKIVSVDENKIKDKGDIFGYASYAVGTDAFYIGSGLRLLETKADGSIAISEDMSSDKANRLASKITTFLSTPTAVATDTAGQGAANGLPEHAWNGGEAMFLNHFMSYLNKDTSFEKGVVPVPMYDEDQEDYRTTCTFGAAMWSVVRGAAEYEDLCTVLDTIASESYRKVTPAYFDTVLAGRQNTKDDYDMLYMIRDSIVIDGGRVMTDPFNEETIKLWRRAMRGEKEYLTLYEAIEVTLAQQAAALNTLMATLEDLYG